MSTKISSPRALIGLWTRLVVGLSIGGSGRSASTSDRLGRIDRGRVGFLECLWFREVEFKPNRRLTNNFSKRCYLVDLLRGVLKA